MMMIYLIYVRNKDLTNFITKKYLNLLDMRFTIITVRPSQLIVVDHGYL